MYLWKRWWSSSQVLMLSRPWATHMSLWSTSILHVSPFPTASTCAPQSTLPNCYTDYGPFKHALNTTMHGGFGMSWTANSIILHTWKVARHYFSRFVIRYTHWTVFGILPSTFIHYVTGSFMSRYVIMVDLHLTLIVTYFLHGVMTSDAVNRSTWLAVFQYIINLRILPCMLTSQVHVQYGSAHSQDQLGTRTTHSANLVATCVNTWTCYTICWWCC